MKEDMLGLQHGTVTLRPHSPRWREEFEIEKAGLKALVGEYVQEVEHIGSTSAGIMAKPVIDILVALRSWKDLGHIRAKLESAGYEYQESGSNDLRALFAKGPREKRTHHIHFTEHQSPEWKKAFAFWDYLRTHPETLKEYEKLKQNLAEKHPTDRDQYSKGKADFIKRVIRTSDLKLSR